MFLLIALASADCTRADLSAHVAAADHAIEALDTERLQLATDALDSSLGCQTTPLQIADAAAVHRVRGIQAFVGGAPDEADRWFAASRALDPSAGLGHSIGGPIQQAWDRATSPIPPERKNLAPARRGTLFIDGQPLNSHPAHLPWVFQHADGPQVSTALITPGTRPPRYPGDQPEPVEGRRKKTLTVLAVTTVALGGAALGAAGYTRVRYQSPKVTDAQAEGLIATNRTLGITGFSLAGLGVGLGTAAVIAGEW